jgi:hypothetical protein
MKEGVDYTIKVIELQIDSSDSQLPFYEKVTDAVNPSSAVTVKFSKKWATFFRKAE